MLSEQSENKTGLEEASDTRVLWGFSDEGWALWSVLKLNFLLSQYYTVKQNGYFTYKHFCIFFSNEKKPIIQILNLEIS